MTRGRERNGSMTEGDWVPGKYGTALEFDGSDDYVDIGIGPSKINTISFWINPTTTTEFVLNIDGTTDYIWVNSGTITATGFIRKPPR